MSEIRAAGVLILFFALRCILPLMITLAIGYLMNRLVDRWEAEEAARQEVDGGTQIAVAAAGATRPESGKLPCWLVRSCDPEKRENCPAYQNPSLPCWIARMLAEGSRPASCPDCPVYDPKLAIN
jgi:hypothetical protein